MPLMHDDGDGRENTVCDNKKKILVFSIAKPIEFF